MQCLASAAVLLAGLAAGSGELGVPASAAEAVGCPASTRPPGGWPAAADATGLFQVQLLVQSGQVRGGDVGDAGQLRAAEDGSGLPPVQGGSSRTAAAAAATVRSGSSGDSGQLRAADGGSGLPPVHCGSVKCVAAAAAAAATVRPDQARGSGGDSAGQPRGAEGGPGLLLVQGGSSGTAAAAAAALGRGAEAEEAGAGGAHDGAWSVPSLTTIRVAGRRATSLVLMFAVSLITAIFYMVNFDNEDLRHARQKMSCTAVSMFSAVLFYFCVKRLLIDLTQPDTAEKVTFLLGLFVILYFLVQVVLALFLCTGQWSRTLTRMAEATLLGRAAGFAAAFGFASLQQLPSFAVSSEMSILVVLLTQACLEIILLCTDLVRDAETALAPDAAVGEDEHFWVGRVKHIEDDILSVCLGFLVMQVIRFWICGSLQPFEPLQHPEGISQYHANMLITCSAGLGCLALSWAAAMERMVQTKAVGSLLLRCARHCQHTSATAIAWCLLFWGDWQVAVFGILDGSQDARTRACAVVALGLTLLIFATMFVLDRAAVLCGIADRAFRPLTLAAGLLVGVSWGRVFSAAFLDIQVEGDSLRLDRSVAVGILVFFVLIGMLPTGLNRPSPEPPARQTSAPR